MEIQEEEIATITIDLKSNEIIVKQYTQDKTILKTLEIKSSNQFINEIKEKIYATD